MHDEGHQCASRHLYRSPTRPTTSRAWALGLISGAGVLLVAGPTAACDANTPSTTIPPPGMLKRNTHATQKQACRPTDRAGTNPVWRALAAIGLVQGDHGVSVPLPTGMPFLVCATTSNESSTRLPRQAAVPPHPRSVWAHCPGCHPPPCGPRELWKLQSAHLHAPPHV